eukprot:SAG11_NODE_1690_length_4443_cov_3.349908_3_plen_155_part_00
MSYGAVCFKKVAANGITLDNYYKYWYVPASDEQCEAALGQCQYDIRNGRVPRKEGQQLAEKIKAVLAEANDNVRTLIHEAAADAKQPGAYETAAEARQAEQISLSNLSIAHGDRAGLTEYRSAPQLNTVLAEDGTGDRICTKGGSTYGMLSTRS